MDAPPPSHGHDKAGVSPPSDRPLRVESEFPIAAILLPLTGPSSLESGRFFVPLERHSGLRVPDSPHPPDPPQDSGRQSDDSPHSPLVAQEALVPGDGEPSVGSPQVVADPPGCDQATDLIQETREPVIPAPDCMAIVGRESRDLGLLDRTSKIYRL